MNIQLGVPVKVMSVFSGCFQYYLLIVSFQQLDCDLCLGVLYFKLLKFAVLESVKIFSPNLGNFSQFFLPILFFPPCEILVRCLLDLLVLSQGLPFYSLNFTRSGGR